MIDEILSIINRAYMIKNKLYLFVKIKKVTEINQLNELIQKLQLINQVYNVSYEILGEI